MKRYLILLTVIFTLIQATSAQENDEPLITSINYGMTVVESITDYAFFDWWQFDATAGDKIVVSMEADDGLQPLLGLMDSGGDILTRSDLETVTEPDGVAFMQYDITTTAQYTIIATRDGRDIGTTTGRYLLTLTNRAETASTRPNPFLESEFRCSEWLITNAMTFMFNEDVELPEEILPGQITEYYSFFAFGLDGFEPVIRLQSDLITDRPLDCTDSALATEGAQLDLPFLDDPMTITEDSADSVAFLTLTNSGEGDPLGEVTVTVGAKEGSSGRYVLVMEGLAINNGTDGDELLIRRGPLATETTLDVYVIGYSDTRLDPTLTLYDPETDLSQLCDDIGRDDCTDLIDLSQAYFLVGEDSTAYRGDRFDAGLRIDSVENSQQTLSIRGRSSTSGNYLVVFVGELPAR